MVICYSSNMKIFKNIGEVMKKSNTLVIGVLEKEREN